MTVLRIPLEADANQLGQIADFLADLLTEVVARQRGLREATIEEPDHRQLSLPLDVLRTSPDDGTFRDDEIPF